MKHNRKYRNTLQYKVKFWLRHLNGRDVKNVLNGMSEIVMGVLFLGLVFVIHAFFH